MTLIDGPDGVSLVALCDVQQLEAWRFPTPRLLGKLPLCYDRAQSLGPASPNPDTAHRQSEVIHYDGTV